jgi:hypothetical protein
MRSMKRMVAGLAMALAVTAGVSFAGSDLNEVGALLVYPYVIGIDDSETFLTITNAGTTGVTAHVSFINGSERHDEYCYECDFEIPLTGNDTEVLVLTKNVTGGLSIESEDGTVSHSCDQPFGFVVVSLEDGFGNTLTDNVLLGSEVVVEYTDGTAFSISAIPFQGKNGGDGDRSYELDDVEYGKMPRIVAADFIAPHDGAVPGELEAELALFTLNFERQHPPEVDCSVTGYDADENPFSRSIIFGCWEVFELKDLSTEFEYPNLGHLPGQLDTHGWFQLNCRVDADGDGLGTFARGGVHGAIIQEVENAQIRRNDPSAPTVTGQASWARLLYQSVTTGDNVTLHLESPAAGLD